MSNLMMVLSDHLEVPQAKKTLEPEKAKKTHKTRVRSRSN